MERPTHRAPLCLGLGAPLPSVGRIDLGSLLACPSRHPVKDRPIDRLIDDVVVGHVCPLFLNTPNLNARPVNGYGAKLRIVQCLAL